MGIQLGFTFVNQNGQYLQWTLVDSLTGAFINNANVTASLYTGRSKANPDVQPGTPIPNFTNINLAFQSNGLYQGLITSAFDTTPAAGYVLVVDATAPGYSPQHWEAPSVVVPRSTS